MIDSHCHLDFREFSGNQDKVIDNARSAGVHTMINIGVSLQSSHRSVELADTYDCVYAAVGVHPHDAKTYDDRVESELVRLTENKKVVAIGETGLDYYRELSPRHVQKKVFRRQLEIAVDKKLPVVIHTRESFPEALEMVKEYSGRLVGGVFHCFPGSVKEAHDVIDLGFHISVGGVITFPKARMATVAAEVPLEHILLETDCPYLTPSPVRGKINQPSYVRYVRNKLALLKNVPSEEIENVTDRNSQKVFRLVDVFEG
jgi:TatD DNase family protein